MRRGIDAGLGLDARHHAQRALAGRAAGAVGDRDEARMQRRELVDRVPEPLLHDVGLGREELEATPAAAAARSLTSRLARWSCGAFMLRSSFVSSLSRQRQTVSPSRSVVRESLRAPRRARPAAARPAAHLRVGQAEPAMGMMGAQEFELVRREIDDQHLAAGLQRAAGLRQQPARIVEIVQHLVDDDEVGRADAGVEIGDVAEPDLRVTDAGGGELGARHRDHLAARVDADAAPVVAGQQLEHAAGAGAEIDQQIDLPAARAPRRSPPRPPPRARAGCAARPSCRRPWRNTRRPAPAAPCAPHSSRA